MNPLAVYAITLGTGIAVGLLRWYSLAHVAPAGAVAEPRPLRTAEDPLPASAEIQEAA